MKSIRASLLSDESGLLTLEWIFLLAICVIGIVTGIGAMRDAVSISFFSGAEAVGAVDPAYEIHDYQGRNNRYTVQGSSYRGGTVSTEVDYNK